MAIVESGKLAAAAVAFAIAPSVSVAAAQAPGASATTGTGVGDAASSASGPSPSRTSEMPAPSQATAKGIDPPAVLDKNDEKAIDDLADLSGAGFDRTYMKRMVSDHRSDVSKFQKEAQAGEDPEIRAAAQNILRVLREHLEMAESIQDGIEAGADNTGRAKQ